MKIIAVLLIVVGLVALVYGGISYNRERTILDIGSIEATVTEQKSIPISPIIGGLALAGGIALLVVGRRRV